MEVESMNCISQDKARKLYKSGVTIGWLIPATDERLETSKKKSGRNFDYWHGFITSHHGENRLYIPKDQIDE